MKLKVLFVVLVTALMPVHVFYGAQKEKAKVEAVKPLADQLIKQAKEAVKLKLKDPESAQFRNVHVKQGEEGVVIGEVNSKNNNGGYSGYEKFYWGFDSKGLRSVLLESKFIETQTGLNRILKVTENIKGTGLYRHYFIDGW